MDGEPIKAARDENVSLGRAVDLLEVVAEGPITLTELVVRLSLPRTTIYRLAVALVERGLLQSSRRSGYAIGGRLKALGDAYVASPASPRASKTRGRIKPST